MRELEIDDLTMESCFAALFDGYLDDLEEGPQETQHYRVTQVGPPRRDPPSGET